MNTYHNDENIKLLLVDCRLQMHYASFYIIGIDRLGLPYSFGIIKDLPIRNKAQLWRGIAFVVQSRKKITKVFIDTNDSDDIECDYYEWCDIYGKVNLKNSDTRQEKMVAVGPNFGVRLGG